MTRSRRIPHATVARLALYARILTELAKAHSAVVSSERLAELAGVNAAKVRKDLSHLGSYGTRGAGYDVELLLGGIGVALGLGREWPVVIVGVGNLGRALANYRGFPARGFRVAALVDADPAKVGTRVGSLTIESVDRLPLLAARERLAIGVVATPPAAAQEAADRLVDAGIGAILNFAPTVLSVPPGVAVRQVDLSSELQILAFYCLRNGSDGKAGPLGAPGSAGSGDAEEAATGEVGVEDAAASF